MSHKCRTKDYTQTHGSTRYRRNALSISLKNNNVHGAGRISKPPPSATHPILRTIWPFGEQLDFGSTSFLWKFHRSTNPKCSGLQQDFAPHVGLAVRPESISPRKIVQLTAHMPSRRLPILRRCPGRLDTQCASGTPNLSSKFTSLIRRLNLSRGGSPCRGRPFLNDLIQRAKPRCRAAHRRRSERVLIASLILTVTRQPLLL